MDVSAARVSTPGAEVVDVFYTTVDGRPLDEERRERAVSALVEAASSP